MQSVVSFSLHQSLIIKLNWARGNLPFWHCLLDYLWKSFYSAIFFESRCVRFLKYLTWTAASLNFFFFFFFYNDHHPLPSLILWYLWYYTIAFNYIWDPIWPLLICDLCGGRPSLSPRLNGCLFNRLQAHGQQTLISNGKKLRQQQTSKHSLMSSRCSFSP